MKTCFSCRHLYQCRMDYDRRYPCRDYESKTYTKTSGRSGADEGEEDHATRGQEKDGLTHVDGGHEERA